MSTRRSAPDDDDEDSFLVVDHPPPAEDPSAAGRWRSDGEDSWSDIVASPQSPPGGDASSSSRSSSSWERVGDPPGAAGTEELTASMLAASLEHVPGNHEHGPEVNHSILPAATDSSDDDGTHSQATDRKNKNHHGGLGFDSDSMYDSSNFGNDENTWRMSDSDSDEDHKGDDEDDEDVVAHNHHGDDAMDSDDESVYIEDNEEASKNDNDEEEDDEAEDDEKDPKRLPPRVVRIVRPVPVWAVDQTRKGTCTYSALPPVPPARHRRGSPRESSPVAPGRNHHTEFRRLELRSGSRLEPVVSSPAAPSGRAGSNNNNTELPLSPALFPELPHEMSRNRLAVDYAWGPRGALASAFRPPDHLVYSTDGTVDEAISLGKATNRLVLVSLQDYDEGIGSHLVNRDIFSNDVVQDLIRAKFIFLQLTTDSEQGRRYCQQYLPRKSPHVAILHPNHGSSIWGMEGWDETSPWDLVEIVQSMTDICFDRYSEDQLAMDINFDEAFAEGKPSASLPATTE